jgi:hypothetical protein
LVLSWFLSYKIYVKGWKGIAKPLISLPDSVAPEKGAGGKPGEIGGQLQVSADLASYAQRLPKPLAVFSYNDCVAADIIDACDDAGLLVPEAVAVLGVDNDALICECIPVPLSSVCHDLEGMAYRAAALLDHAGGLDDIGQVLHNLCGTG